MSRLSPQQSRLQDDLRGLIEGEVRCDVVTQQLYATDASPFEIRPQGVVWPRTRDDVVQCVRYAGENNISIHARGSGTGRNGGALGKGLILDFSRYMRRVIHSEEDWVRVQPGLTLSRLNQHLGRLHQRRIGPDPGFRPTTTLGSVLGGDGAGSRWLKYGSPRNHVRSLEVVLANGEVLELHCPDFAMKLYGQEGIGIGEENASLNRQTLLNRQLLNRQRTLDRSVAEEDGQSVFSGSLNRLNHELKSILSPVQQEIGRLQLENRPDRSGYRLNGVLSGISTSIGTVTSPYRSDDLTLQASNGLTPEISNGLESNRSQSVTQIVAQTVEQSVDWSRLFVGSEGTLGLITEATLKTVPLPFAENSVLLLFDSLEQAVRSIPRILDYQPSVCDLMDRRRVNMVRDEDKRAQLYLPQESEAAILVEVDDETNRGVQDRLLELVEGIQTSEKACFGTCVAEEEQERFLFRSFFDRGELALARMPYTVYSLPLINGIFVPVEKMPHFLLNIQNLCKRNEVSASFFGPIGQGQLDIQLLIPRSCDSIADLLNHLCRELFVEVLHHNGSISCSGVLGITGTPFLRLQHELLYPFFRQIKELLDPQQILNPGKVVASSIEEESDWSRLLRLKKGG
ncbi:MAG: FAD-binding oxidoreductase [Thermoguttaceae bacterium]